MSSAEDWLRQAEEQSERRLLRQISKTPQWLVRALKEIQTAVNQRNGHNRDAMDRGFA
ncbi:hypothetical protein [Actinophytocola sp.]|uniref:hypothetical protein n=1 Tax=Actinophytocola sp. TaxID=1872138 RepID=UPI002EDBB194